MELARDSCDPISLCKRLPFRLPFEVRTNGLTKAQ